MYTPPLAMAVDVLPVLVFVVVLVYNPVTSVGETNSDWLFDTFTVVFMTWAKLSGVTSTAAPLNMSRQEAGRMPPMFETPLYVQPTAVLIAAVAFELGVPFWAKAIVTVNSENRGVNFFIEIISEWDLTKLCSASPLAGAPAYV